MPFLGMPFQLNVQARFVAGGALQLDDAHLLLRFRPTVFRPDPEDISHSRIVTWPLEDFRNHPRPIFAGYANRLFVDAEVNQGGSALPAISASYWSLEDVGAAAGDRLIKVTLLARQLSDDVSLIAKGAGAARGKKAAKGKIVDPERALRAFRDGKLRERADLHERRIAAIPQGDRESRRDLVAARDHSRRSVAACAASIQARRNLLPDEGVLRRNLYNAVLEQCDIQLQLDLDGAMKNRGALFLKLAYQIVA